MNNFQQNYGPWGVVTGATAGIGNSFVHQLAEKGINIVLVARNESNLNDLANELRSQYKIETQIVAADLSDPDQVTKVTAVADEFEVGLLVNNAGVEQVGSLVHQDRKSIQRLTQLNVAAPIELARVFGSKMSKRRRGGIIFVASALAYQGVPSFSVYAASKANMLVLGESLHYELKPLGVDVLTLSPGVTQTPMADRFTNVDFGRIGLMKLSPQFVAAVGLRNLGRRASVVTGVQYKFFNFLVKWILPRSFSSWMFGKLMWRSFNNKPEFARATGDNTAAKNTRHTTQIAET